MPKFYCVYEIAKQLGVGKSKIYTEIESKKLAHYKIG